MREARLELDEDLEEPGELGWVERCATSVSHQWQKLLDLSVPYIGRRWAISALVACVYCVRAYLLKGWYIVSYGLAIYQLSLLIGFLTPQAADPWPEIDPDTEDPFAPDGGLLGAVPLSKDGTYMRTIPEFKYWYRLTKAFAVAFSLTFFELFNVPVSRPILVMYFVLLFFQAGKRQIEHMIKYQYLPCSFGKKPSSPGAKPVAV